MSESLERELARHLAPAKAPETLWGMRLSAASRSYRANAADSRSSIAWNPGKKMLFSPALVLILLTVAAGAVWKSDQPGSGLLNDAAPAKLSQRHQEGNGPKANQIIAIGPAGTQAFSESCLMCHTGATLYVSP